MNSYMKRLAYYLSGLFILTLGISLSIKSDLGAGAWDALNVGLSNTVGFTVGTWVIVVGIVLIVVNAILTKSKPDFLALITIFITGVFIDFWLLQVMDDLVGQTVLLEYVILLGGMVFMGFGISLYMQGKLAIIPIDGLMMAIRNRTGLNLMVSKTIGELTALVAALIFEGPIGIGTVLITFGIGPLVQFFYPKIERYTQ
ncbi:YczE/YyaS/YitT family protein [Pseudalkalibacillus caeni]|uniref:Membrane protein n=1 Tax=Exobacillus caeni TaxID=2574798 RepID=A0A5R9EZU9_9BACL|nr:membrane protein [Pseudalkalibacillus caeni]TLS35726.1 membrane protein [Pseudalkalibacillus caeni]